MTEMRERLAGACRRHGVSSLYVFGSRASEIAARGRGKEPAAPVSSTADADIAVEPAPGALRSPRERVTIAAELESLFDVPRVDLVILPEAGPFLAADAIRGELLFCDDEVQQSREELFYLRRAGDLAPFQRDRLHLLLSGELRQ